jgi:hypothetical protein
LDRNGSDWSGASRWRFPTYHDALAAERAAIRTENPIFNIAGRKDGPARAVIPRFKGVAPLNARFLEKWKPAHRLDELTDGAVPGLRVCKTMQGLSWSLNVRFAGERKRFAVRAQPH